MEKDQTTLTLRQQRFVDCYLADGCKNAKAAAVAAGYSARYAGQNAGKLLKNPSVARALAQRQQTISQQANIDATYVIQGLVRVFETCSARVPAVNMMGEQVQDESGRPAWKLIDAAGANGAIKGLMLALGVGSTEESTDNTISSLAKSLQSALDALPSAGRG